MKKKFTCIIKFFSFTILLTSNINSQTFLSTINKPATLDFIKTNNPSIEFLQQNINQYVDVKAGINLLTYAVINQDYDLAESLLEYGADPLAYSKQVGNGKIYQPLDFAKDRQNYEIERLLLKYILKKELEKTNLKQILQRNNLTVEQVLQNTNTIIDASKNLTFFDYVVSLNNSKLLQLLFEYGVDSNQHLRRPGNKFEPYDVSIIGLASFNDGLGRISIGIIDQLRKDLRINFVQTRNLKLFEEHVNKDVAKIIKQNRFAPTKVVIYTDTPTYSYNLRKFINNKTLDSAIKIAYSMFESSKIPKKWVNDLNNYFDAVVVPDNFLVDVYKRSGVTKPIFVLPIGLYLNEFLNRPIKSRANKPFVFSCLSSFDPRKNQLKLIEAFAKAFGNNFDVVLKLNGRSFDNTALRILLNRLNIRNIVITNNNLNWHDYISFMNATDCYVNISKGEGFSITPRESLALGIPTIITNNTAQKTICNSGFVEVIESNILEKASYKNLFEGENLGYFFDCNVDDVVKALKNVYFNYNSYLNKSNAGKRWVKKYNWNRLKKKYITLVKPKNVVLGQHNKISNDALETNSQELYNKYNLLLGKTPNEVNQ